MLRRRDYRWRELVYGFDKKRKNCKRVGDYSWKRLNTYLRPSRRGAFLLMPRTGVLGHLAGRAEILPSPHVFMATPGLEEKGDTLKLSGKSERGNSQQLDCVATLAAGQILIECAPVYFGVQEHANRPEKKRINRVRSNLPPLPLSIASLKLNETPERHSPTRMDKIQSRGATKSTKAASPLSGLSAP